MKKIKPTIDFDDRPLSWSAMGSFDYDPEQWWRKYCLHGKCTRKECLIQEPGRKCPLRETSPEMEFGKTVGERLASDPSYLPEVPRLSVFEYKFTTKVNGIKVIGFADSFCITTLKKLKEYKTGVKKWDQKRADEHGQIDFYLLMNNLMDKVKPEDVEIELVWLPTKRSMNAKLKVTIEFAEPFKPQIFRTKRTTEQVAAFGRRLIQTARAMKKYADDHAPYVFSYPQDNEYCA